MNNYGKSTTTNICDQQQQQQQTATEYNYIGHTITLWKENQ